MSSTIGILTHVMGYWSCRHFNPKKWVIATHLFLQCSIYVKRGLLDIPLNKYLEYFSSHKDE